MLKKIAVRCPDCESSDLESRSNVTKPMKYLRISDERRSKLLENYNNLTSVGWRELEANYVYYGPWERQLSDIDLEKDQNLVLVYKNPEVEIYRIKK